MSAVSDERARVWVEDRAWRVPSWYSKCRQRSCPNPPMADLVRAQRFSFRRWAYCTDHLYGRRLENGRVLVEVHADSPAAQRGWA